MRLRGKPTYRDLAETIMDLCNQFMYDSERSKEPVILCGCTTAEHEAIETLEALDLIAYGEAYGVGKYELIWDNLHKLGEKSG